MSLPDKGRVVYLGAVERRARATGIGDAEGVLWEGAQDPTGVLEELEGLVTGVGDGRGDLQVPQSIDLVAWGRGLDGQAGGGRHDDRRGDEGNEGSTEGRGEHRGKGIEEVGEATPMRPGN